jgi:hypothetical protein
MAGPGSLGLLPGRTARACNWEGHTVRRAWGSSWRWRQAVEHGRWHPTARADTGVGRYHSSRTSRVAGAPTACGCPPPKRRAQVAEKEKRPKGERLRYICIEADGAAAAGM